MISFRKKSGRKCFNKHKGSDIKVDMVTAEQIIDTILESLFVMQIKKSIKILKRN